MPHSAKDLRVAPIARLAANAFVRRHHYSGKVVRNSQVHLGVFLTGRLEGVLQFGPSLDKRKLQSLVLGTPWNDFIELNRMVLSERLPRNSESRALAVAMRMLRQTYPAMQWVVTFADGTQCGDGTIYRAAGFVLTGIRRNISIWQGPDGSTAVNLALRQGALARERTINKTGVTARLSGIGRSTAILKVTSPKGSAAIASNGGASMRPFIAAGYRPANGYQLRYVFFLDPAARARLAVPEIPYARINELGVGMYRGDRRGKQATAGHPLAGGGAAPTPALQATHDRRRGGPRVGT